MKRIFIFLLIGILISDCYAINFVTNNKSYPIWAFQQYNFCRKEKVDSSNNNNIVLFTHTVETWPFGIEYEDFSFLINREIEWKKMTIYSFSYQSKNIEIFILKNKTIINHDRMFNLIKMYWFPKEMKNEKTVTAKLEYSLDDGKKYTEYTEIYVW